MECSCAWDDRSSNCQSLSSSPLCDAIKRLRLQRRQEEVIQSKGPSRLGWTCSACLVARGAVWIISLCISPSVRCGPSLAPSQPASRSVSQSLPSLQRQPTTCIGLSMPPVPRRPILCSSACCPRPLTATRRFLYLCCFICKGGLIITNHHCVANYNHD